ncbi:hypothetical protein AC1031_002594 [Aphanomyces cochlioides]|nr:hypothetical protein AC1031_002594 [Aphanomyces cochlioides]
MKVFLLLALLAVHAFADGSMDLSAASSQPSTRVNVAVDDKNDAQEDIGRSFGLDMTGFRDHRPSHPVYIYAPHFDLPIDMSDDDTSVVTFLPRRGQRKSIRLRYGRQSTEEEDGA